MKYKIINNPETIDKDAWDEFVASHPKGNPFQAHDIYTFFDKIKQYKSIIISCEDENKQIVGILQGIIQKEKGLKSYFSKRCIVWGGPLVLNDDLYIAEIMIKEFVKIISKKAIYAEFRNLFDTSRYREILSKYDFEFQEHLNYIVNIDNETNIRQRISSSKRRQLKKGLNSGVQIIEAESEKQIEEFHSILKNLYYTKVKKPLPPMDFFINFYKTDLGKYLLLKYDDAIIGGIMCIIYKNTIYEWFIAGKDIEYKNLYPSVLSTWAPIQYALNHNLQYFDFMGAGKPDKNYGVREFKSKFGGQLVDYGRYMRINKKFLYQLGKLGMKILSIIK